MRKLTHQQIDLLVDLHPPVALLGEHRLPQGLYR